MLVQQLKQDLERLMPQIYKSPDIGISVLYALVLNSEMDKID